MREMQQALQNMRLAAGRARARPRRRPRRAPNRVQYDRASVESDPSTMCALHYGEALLDPFDTPAGVCIPKFPSVLSAKRKIFAKGTGACVAGNGGVVVLPTMGNDATTIVYSQTGWIAGGPDDLPAQGDPGVGTASPNSGYTSADFGGNVHCRLVAIGVRVRYIGTRLNAGGRAYSLEEPDHKTLESAPLSVLRAYDMCQALPWDGQWVTCLYQPRFPADFAYAADASGNEGGQVGFLGISIQSADATAPFEWEVFSHWEAIGSGIRGKTESHSSPVMTDKILSAVSQAPGHLHAAVAKNPELARKVTAVAATKGASMWNKIGSVLASGASGYGAAGPMGGLLAGGAQLLKEIF